MRWGDRQSYSLREAWRSRVYSTFLGMMRFSRHRSPIEKRGPRNTLTHDCQPFPTYKTFRRCQLIQSPLRFSNRFITGNCFEYFEYTSSHARLQWFRSSKKLKADRYRCPRLVNWLREEFRQIVGLLLRRIRAGGAHANGDLRGVLALSSFGMLRE